MKLKMFFIMLFDYLAASTNVQVLCLWERISFRVCAANISVSKKYKPQSYQVMLCLGVGTVIEKCKKQSKIPNQGTT
jgi:hypothetical protein